MPPPPLELTVAIFFRGTFLELQKKFFFLSGHNFFAASLSRGGGNEPLAQGVKVSIPSTQPKRDSCVDANMVPDPGVLVRSESLI